MAIFAILVMAIGVINMAILGIQLKSIQKLAQGCLIHINRTYLPFRHYQHICDFVIFMPVREAIWGKICIRLDIFQTALTLPPVFLDSFKELLKNLILYELKFLKVLDFGHPPLFSLENV